MKIKLISKKVVAVLLLIVLLVSSIVTTVGAATASVTITTSKIQNNTMLCWAACASMSGTQVRQNNLGLGQAVTQNQIVVYIKGSVVNLGASLAEIKNAANYAYDPTGVRTWYVTTAPTSVTVSTLHTQIANGRSFIIEMYKSGGAKHVITVWQSDNTNNRFQYYDPWDGKAYYMTYTNYQKTGSNYFAEPRTYQEYVNRAYTGSYDTWRTNNVIW